MATRARVPTLDGWRAIAVLLVVWHHFIRGFYPNAASYYGESLSRFGAAGVDVFFGISGLIITKLLLDEFRASGHLDFRGFYIRRAFRILPPCFAYLTFILLAGAIRTPLELAASALFFRNYIPDPSTGDATKHLWSLAVEEHFYLFWPLLLAGVLLYIGFKNGAVAVAWLSIACALWRVADAQNDLTARWLPLVPAHFRTDLRLDALLWGCAAAFLLADKKQRDRLRDGLRPWMLCVAILLAVGAIVLYGQSRPAFPIFVPLTFLGTLWLPILIPLILLATVLHPEWLFSRILDQRPLQFVGRISYSLYLWQQFFLAPGWDQQHFFQRAPWNLLLTVACALLSYRFIEKPFIALGRRLSSRKSLSSISADCEPQLTGAVL